MFWHHFHIKSIIQPRGCEVLLIKDLILFGQGQHFASTHLCGVKFPALGNNTTEKHALEVQMERSTN